MRFTREALRPQLEESQLHFFKIEYENTSIVISNKMEYQTTKMFGNYEVRVYGESKELCLQSYLSLDDLMLPGNFASIDIALIDKLTEAERGLAQLANGWYTAVATVRGLHRVCWTVQLDNIFPVRIWLTQLLKEIANNEAKDKQPIPVYYGPSGNHLSGSKIPSRSSDSSDEEDWDSSEDSSTSYGNFYIDPVSDNSGKDGAHTAVIEPLDVSNLSHSNLERARPTTETSADVANSTLELEIRKLELINEGKRLDLQLRASEDASEDVLDEMDVARKWTILNPRGALRMPSYYEEYRKGRRNGLSSAQFFKMIYEDMDNKVALKALPGYSKERMIATDWLYAVRKPEKKSAFHYYGEYCASVRGGPSLCRKEFFKLILTLGINV